MEIINISSRLKQRLHEHPWIVTSFAAGVLVGALFCLPLVPYELPDSAANILGAALGALFAVWGAEWVAQRKERRRELMARSAIAATAIPVHAAAHQLERLLTGATIEDAGRMLEVHETAMRLKTIVPAFKLRVTDMQPLFVQLGGEGFISYNTLKDMADALMHAADLALTVRLVSEERFAGPRVEALDFIKGVRGQFQEALNPFR